MDGGDATIGRVPLSPAKFRNPFRTASGETRASVPFVTLSTLWFNTGTLCNIACTNCYIESSPRNDRLAWLTAGEVEAFLDEAGALARDTVEIGFTGGEPFMNPDIVAMLDSALSRGYRTLVLTNGMRPMRRHERALRDLLARYGERLVLRVSLDHYTPAGHEAERGARSWQPALDGLGWLAAGGFAVHVAGRTFTGETEAELRTGYAALFAAHDIAIDAADPSRLVLFPEMDAGSDVPEITTACWSILGVAPEAQMCASSRMVVKRKGDARPVVMPCTLLPYDEAFAMGEHLAEAIEPVALNHPHCARFCVLGGGSCSRA